MSEFNQKNVLVGLGKLSVDGTSLGYTSGGVILAVSTDRVDKETDQSYAPVGIFKVRERYEIRTNLAEITLENLKLVWEQTAAIEVLTGPNRRRLKWGMNQNVVEHTLEFIGKSPEQLDRTFTAFKAVVFAIGDTPHQKDALTVIPITFRILPDTTQAAGEEYGTIVDAVSEIDHDIDEFETIGVSESRTLTVV